MAKKPISIQALIKSILPWVGWAGLIVCLGLITITSCIQHPAMNQQSTTYQQAKKNALLKANKLPEEYEQEALDRFTQFLEGIGSSAFIEREIANVYSQDAYLNDTLKTLVNRSEIKAHFIKTSKAMTDYSVSIDDVAKSDEGYYIRWTMKYKSPKLAKGEEIESIGITHVIFDASGKALLHQDFWDSSNGFFEHVPVLGGGIRIVKKRL